MAADMSTQIETGVPVAAGGIVGMNMKNGFEESKVSRFSQNKSYLLSCCSCSPPRTNCLFYRIIYAQSVPIGCLYAGLTVAASIELEMCCCELCCCDLAACHLPMLWTIFIGQGIWMPVQISHSAEMVVWSMA